MAGIIVKSNPTSGSTPDPQYLAVGELAFNSYDGRLFSKKHNGELVLLNYKPNPTASIADTANSSSYALTASYALNGGGGGGGQAIYTKYDPFAPPTNPSVLNDEFTVSGSGIPSGWTLATGSGTVTVLNGRCIITPLTGSGDNPTAIEKVLPTGGFTVLTRMELLGKNTYHNSAIYLRDTVSGKVTVFRIFCGPSNDIRLLNTQVLRYNSFTSFNSISYEGGAFSPTVFHRIDFDGTTLYFARSFDGVEYDILFSEPASSWFSTQLPNRVGICASTINTSVGCKAVFDFFRHSSTPFADLGREVGVGSDGNGSTQSNAISSSWASSSISASYATTALTASFALNGGGGGAPINTGSFATTGSNIFIGNQTITGSLTLSSSLPVELRVIGDTEITGSLRTSGLSVVSGSLAISSPNTLVLGSQIFYPQSSNGFSVNENFDPSNDSNQVAYHFTTGTSAKTSVVFGLARTNRFTSWFGVTGDVSNNQFVIGSEFAGTDFEFRSNLGIRPVQLQGGNLLARITRTGHVLANAFTSSLVNQVGFLGTSSWARNSATASTATSAATASLLLGSIESASYAATASVLLGSVQSASYAVTASFALNGGTGGGSSVSASWASSSISASFATSASFANTAITSSYALTSLSGITVNLTGSTVGVNVYRSASLTLTDNNLNYIPFTTERRDDLNFWDISDPTKLIVPNGADGWYTISGYCHWNANTGLGRRISIVVDGTETVGYSSTVAYFEHNDPGTHAGAVVYLTSGSFVQLGVSENDGDNVPINASASIGMVRIGSSTNVPSASFATTASYALNSNQSQTSLSRGTVSANVASISPNQNYTGSISLGKTFMLLSTQVNTDVRLRLYGSQSYVNSDLTRPIGTDPANNSGIITDLILSGSPALYNYTLSPIANGANMDPVTVSTIYYTVTNLSGTTTDISMSFNRIVLE